MDNEFDINKVTSDFLTNFINEKFEATYKGFKGLLKKGREESNFLFKTAHTNYIEFVAKKYYKAKSFLIKDHPVPLYDFYVPLGISSKVAEFPEASILSILEANPFSVVMGTGGCGKSVMMRHLFLDCLATQVKVPIFIELRDLNQTPRSLLEMIAETLRANRFTLGTDYILKALERGDFAILLDGFDEVVETAKPGLIKEIHEFVRAYEKSVVVVSSRVNQEFYGWHDFDVWYISPLTLPQAIEVVSKPSTPFERDIIDRFVKDLTDNLYEKHKSFASLPLLLCIMLLTYEVNADIPYKRSLFYQEAYEALFQQHDARKINFKRERKTKLDKEEFAKIFGAFSITTYDKRIFTFDSQGKALSYLDLSKKFVPYEFASKDYLYDAIESVCLLIKDGSSVEFAHRSFQEYFAAKYILEQNNEDVQKRLLAKYGRNVGHDAVISLLYEMDPLLLERGMFIPVLDDLFTTVDKENPEITEIVYKDFLQKLISKLDISEKGVLGGYNFSSLSLVVELIIETYFNDVPDFGRLEIPNDEIVMDDKDWPFMTLRIEEIVVEPKWIKILAESDWIFSLRTSEKLFDLKQRLEQKHKKTQESIEEILGI